MSCFQFLLTGQPSVQSSYTSDIYECVIYCLSYDCFTLCGFQGVEQNAYNVSVNNSGMLTVDTSVVPSWQYSFQCSSSLLQNYIPVLIISYTISGLVLPLLRVIYARLDAATIDLLLVQIPIFSCFTNFIQETIYVYDLEKKGIIMTETGSSRDHPTGESTTNKRKAFNALQVCSQLCLNIGVFLTFGLASPLVTVVVAVDAVGLYFAWMLLLCRYLHIHTKNPQDDVAVAWMQLEDATDGLASGLPIAVLVVVAFAGVFWGLFVFDMIGDIFGAVVGAFVVLLPVVGSLMVYICASIINDWLDAGQPSPAPEPEFLVTAVHLNRVPRESDAVIEMTQPANT
jgi:hypothetical protein